MGILECLWESRYAACKMSMVLVAMEVGEEGATDSVGSQVGAVSPTWGGSVPTRGSSSSPSGMVSMGQFKEVGSY